MARKIKNAEKSVRRQTHVVKRGPAADALRGWPAGAFLLPSQGRATGELLGGGSGHGGTWPHTAFRK